MTPESDVPVSLYDEPIDETQTFDMVSRKKAEEDEVTGQEPVEVIEIGPTG